MQPSNQPSNPRPGPFLLWGLVVILAAAFIACGPSSRYQANQQELNGITTAAQDQEATPTPGNYPNLDDTLKDLVRKYETNELTEEAAAALASESYGNKVLIEVNTSGTGTHIDAVDKWMGQQSMEPRHARSTPALDYIYAYARVSLLGALSERKGVTRVIASRAPYDPETTPTHPGQSIPEHATRAAQGPQLPFWLNDYAAPYEYAKFKHAANYLMILYQKGELTQEVKEDWSFECLFFDDLMAVTVVYDSAETSLATVKSWATSNGGRSNWTKATSHEHGIESFVVLVPFAKLVPLSELTGVLAIEADYCGMGGAYPGSTSGFISPQISSGDQARRAHGVLTWNTGSPGSGITGDTIKVGIIDLGFSGFDGLPSDAMLVVCSTSALV